MDACQHVTLPHMLRARTVEVEQWRRRKTRGQMLKSPLRLLKQRFSLGANLKEIRFVLGFLLSCPKASHSLSRRPDRYT
jgi:hypothetical protein